MCMDKYVEATNEALIESKRFFGNSNKQNRELWVLREFLSYLPLKVSDEDICLAKTEPHDVMYREFGFQIKEVLSEGRKRGKENAAKLAAITSDTKPEDVVWHYTPNYICLDEALPWVASELERHRAKKYKGNSSRIDVLVYLNLTNTTYTETDVQSVHDEFANWRSVSLVSNNCAIILACDAEGHDFLTPMLGNLYFKNEH